jgi:hypothetical protein
MSIEIRPVASDEERQAVYRLRYEVYIAEMGRTQRYVDHARRQIEDPLDAHGLNLAAWHEDTMVGAVRCNWATEDLGEYVELYQMRRFGRWHPEQTYIATKLVIAPPYRRRWALAVRLASAGFQAGLARGCRFNFIDCSPPRLTFFLRLGYRQVFPNVHHPDYGEVHPLVLSVSDREHFAAIGSPFVRHVDRHAADPEAVAYFNELCAAPVAVEA